MPRVRQSADIIAALEGAMWLALAWSVNFSIWEGSTMPTVAAMTLVATILLVSWGHRPMRVTLRRFRVRRRRTEMQMHLFALPLLMALFFAIVVEGLLVTPLTGSQKMLLVNVLASAGWVVFVLTQAFKSLLFILRSRFRTKTKDDVKGKAH
ncbi:hypothetical protein [Halomonas sp. YLGW01]|uniref:hypothetical protein n=1 Tax=Halomonas sp. YLGW01 TaxID=2773308 RepID=UPI00177F55D2|nr:hypothetical protein [Halomonas sp. YLGW01]